MLSFKIVGDLMLARATRRAVLVLTLLAISGCSEKTGKEVGLQRVVDFSPGDTMSGTFPLAQWVRSTASEVPNPNDPFLESGAYFVNKKITAPNAKRIEAELCAGCWVVGNIYTQSVDQDLDSFLQIVDDPSEPGNQVMRLVTTAHTDGAIIRSRAPLPENYRISFRIGHIDYGSQDQLNGYDSGNETGEPWMDISALKHNGVYWAAIMDTRPAPHNNIWSHHHRKFFIDSWNTPGRIFGVTVGGVKGLASTDNRFGKQFTGFDGVAWRNGGEKPAFYYLPDEWYDVVVSREDDEFSFSVTGAFGGLGEARITNSIDARENCLYHYNRRPENLSERCMNGEVIRFDGQLIQTWPKDNGYPDYFMMGDPHINFYEGSVLIDDLRLEVL